MIGKMWGWLQEDNESVKITGVRWLVIDEARKGKTRPSLVVHLNSCKTVTLLRMGRRVYRTTRYDWNRKGGGERSERGQGSVRLEGDDYRGSGEAKAVEQTVSEDGGCDGSFEGGARSYDEYKKSDEYKRCYDDFTVLVMQQAGYTRAMAEEAVYKLFEWGDIV